MRGVNRVIVLGNATRDAELRHTKSGKPVANMRLATNRVVHGPNGERTELTEYHTVICWDRLAETTATYVQKGKPVYVEGRLATRTYKDRLGNEREVTEIMAHDVQFLGTPPAGGPDADEAGSEAESAAAAADVNLDEIPF